MRPQVTGFSTSALVHGAFGLLLYTLTTLAPEMQPPVVIDLSLLAGPSAPQAPMAVPTPTPPAPKPVIQPSPPAAPQVARQELVPPRQEVVQPRKRKKMVHKPILPTPEAVHIPAPPLAEATTPPVAEAPTREAPAVSQATTQLLMATNHEGTSVGGTGRPATAEASSTGQTLSVEERWRQEHFNFIKEAIRKNMTYPVVARRNGWQGKVLVSFVICLDGRVEDIRIEKSSGFALLDKNALTIIKESAPFPSPPVRATLIVPIDFTLS